MSIDRYASDSLVQGGKILGTNKSLLSLRTAIAAGKISLTTYVLQDGDRLDALAGRFYGDGTLWWVIAAASNVGWWLQIPPGTRILIPNDINQVKSVI